MIYHLGLDIGTTATKACAFSPAGEMLGFAEHSYALLHPVPGAAVQEPLAVLRAAEAALADLVQTMGHKPAGWFSQVLDEAFEAQLDGVFGDEAGGLAWLTERMAKGVV